MKGSSDHLLVKSHRNSFFTWDLDVLVSIRMEAVQTLKPHHGKNMFLRRCSGNILMIVTSFLLLCPITNENKVAILNVGIVVQMARAMLHELFPCFLPGSFTDAGNSTAMTWIYFFGNEFIRIHSQHNWSNGGNFLQFLEVLKKFLNYHEEKYKELIPKFSHILSYKNDRPN